MSNLGLLAGSSFMHIFISLQMWGEMPGGIVGLKPSKATWRPNQRNNRCCQMSRQILQNLLKWFVKVLFFIFFTKSRLQAFAAQRGLVLLTFMPISMLDRSAKGTSLVTSSHSRIAKLHMSADRRLISSGFFCRAGHHKEQWVKVTWNKHAETHNRHCLPFYCFYSHSWAFR